MLEIITEGAKTSIIISDPTPNENEIIERAKAVQEGIPYNPRKHSKEEIKSMFAKFRCNQKGTEQSQSSEEPPKGSATPAPQIPDIPEKYFSPAEPLNDDDYPF